MGNAVPMTVKVYPVRSFQKPDVLLPYTLSDPLRVVPMGTPPLVTITLQLETCTQLVWGRGEVIHFRLINLKCITSSLVYGRKYFYIN